MRLGRDRGVAEVIRVRIVLVAEVEPGVRILVHEQRIGAADVGVAAVMHRWAARTRPRSRLAGIDSGRSRWPADTSSSVRSRCPSARR